MQKSIKNSKTNNALEKEAGTLAARPPRILRRDEAAAYCALSAAGFSKWILDGRLPGPIPGTARWDIRAIDAALDRASSIDAKLETTAFDQWKVKHHARTSKGST